MRLRPASVGCRAGRKEANAADAKAAAWAVATQAAASVSASNLRTKATANKGQGLVDPGATMELDDEDVVGMHKREHRNKIVCTIGPSTDTFEGICQLAEAGMDVARLNFSHGTHETHGSVIDLVKRFNAVGRKPVALLLDTKGPEVRSGDVPKPIQLRVDSEIIFSIDRATCTPEAASAKVPRVSVNYDAFITDVAVGDVLLVDGGIISLDVVEMSGTEVRCRAREDGEFKSRRHLNVRGKSATLPSITEKDWEDLKFGLDQGVDFYALSFVNGPECVIELKNFLRAEQTKRKLTDAQVPRVLVKIESAQSITCLKEILTAADGAMVARGDLGAELPVEEVPIIQREIIKLCWQMRKPVIVATNMLESMIEAPMPTRAEVSDIAIAVRERTDATMLSGETANGNYPIRAVATMGGVAAKVEKELDHMGTSGVPSSWLAGDHVTVPSGTLGDLFAAQACDLANKLGEAVPIVVFTRTGNMAITLSHFRPSTTIYAFTNDQDVERKLCLYNGVRPILLGFDSDMEDTINSALNTLHGHELVERGKFCVVVQSGTAPIWRKAGTHVLQVRTV